MKKADKKKLQQEHKAIWWQVLLFPSCFLLLWIGFIYRLPSEYWMDIFILSLIAFISSSACSLFIKTNYLVVCAVLSFLMPFPLILVLLYIEFHWPIYSIGENFSPSISYVGDIKCLIFKSLILSLSSAAGVFLIERFVKKQALRSIFAGPSWKAIFWLLIKLKEFKRQ